MIKILEMRKLKIILRSLLRQRLNSGIIIISLTTGFACFNMIQMFINRELGTDNFHENAGRIFALKCDDPWEKGGTMYHCRAGSAEFLKKNFAAFEDFCRINNAGVQKIIANNQEYVETPYIISASVNFFNFFSYELITSNPGTALETGNSIVISDEIARKYFGNQEPVGQIITLISRNKPEEMVVSGIFRRPYNNTQINFDMVRLLGDQDSRCYVLLASGSNENDAEKLLSENRENIPVIHAGTPGSYYLEPLNETYFDTSRGMTIEATRNKTDLLIAMIIGLMIIGIAAFNYTGLLNNIIIRKSKDYVIRRINGGSRAGLILDFLTGYGIILIVSFIISLFLMADMLPFFNTLTGSKIPEEAVYDPGQILNNFIVVFVLFILTLLFAMVRINHDINIQKLKDFSATDVRKRRYPAFNIFQLAASIVLIICSLVISKQMRYISEKPIGLDKSVIEIRLPGQHQDKVSVFRGELLAQTSIESVSIVGASPLLEHFLVSLSYDDDGVRKEYVLAGFSGDENYLNTLGIDLIEGEGFTGNPAADQTKCLVNQAFTRLFQDKELIGRGIPGMENKTISGIIRDFNYSGLTSVVEPAFISFSKEGTHLLAKPVKDHDTKAREVIAGIWKNLIPDYPLNIETVGERFEWYHRSNKNYIRLIGSCSIISLFLSVIGLFAVAYESSRLRTKETGIRKINGATTIEILILLNRDFAKWVNISFIIACPIAWYAMHKWLQNYAFRTDFSWWIFAIAGLVVLSVTLITVTLQSWRMATRNPVEALRYE